MCGIVAISVALFCGANVSTQKDKKRRKDRSRQDCTKNYALFEYIQDMRIKNN